MTSILIEAASLMAAIGSFGIALEVIFACLIALVLIIVLDIDAPRVGMVGVSPDSLLRLQESLAPVSN